MKERNKQSFKRYHLIVYGKVQRVFFRFYAREEAQKRNLTGWVRNNKNGTVEMEVEGEKLAVEDFIKWCYQGSSLAKVKKIEKKEIALQKKEDSFKIIIY